MAEEITKEQGNEQQQGGTDDSAAYIEALKEMKENYIKKTEYEKIRKDRDKLIEMVKEGETIKAEPVEAEPTVEELRKELFSGTLDNLTYAEKALQLRAKLIEEHGEGADPFVPEGLKTNFTKEDKEKAEALAEVLQQCIDEAEGDPGVFQAKLNNRIRDTGPVMGKRRF